MGAAVLQVLVAAFEAVEPADENLQFRKKAGQDQINRLHYIARMKAIAALDLNSPQSRRALAFLVEHGTVIDPALALFEFMTRSTAKPPVTFELGIAKIPPELAAILADVKPSFLEIRNRRGRSDVRQDPTGTCCNPGGRRTALACCGSPGKKVCKIRGHHGGAAQGWSTHRCRNGPV